MEIFLNFDLLQTHASKVVAWAQNNVFAFSVLIQIIVVSFAFVLAWFSAPHCRRWLGKKPETQLYERFVFPVAQAFEPLTLPFLWLIAQWFSLVTAQYSKWPHHLIKITVSLLAAWVVIRLATVLIRNRQWSRAIALTAWSVAALSITALLDPAIQVLDSMALQFGGFKISVLGVGKALIAVGVLLWIAGAVSGLAERRIFTMPGVTPAAGVLLGKVFRIVVYTLAVVLGLDAVGIDLTAFAVFSGAVGLGIGFGLQKVFSNLISGLILLIDRSLKPGDVIAISDSYGWINSLGARCVSVITRDGTEHLIPNEELISQRVENWSYTNNLVRRKLSIGVDYATNVRTAIELVTEVATQTKRVLTSPAPVCHLRSFGDNSIDLELRFWINDPQNGIGNVSSEILLGIWDSFLKNEIQFPFPQRDIHIRNIPKSMFLSQGTSTNEEA